MFSKTKITDPIGTDQDTPKTTVASAQGTVAKQKPTTGVAAAPASTQRVRPATSDGPSVISTDLKVIGNLKTDGDLQIEGTVEGDIYATFLTIGEKAIITGEVVADDVVVNGKVIGRIRGNKVRLSSTGCVEGDIMHKTISIEAGAHFEGSVQRGEDPLSTEHSKPSSESIPFPSKTAETKK